MNLFSIFLLQGSITKKLKRTGGYYVSGKKKQGILLLYVFITVSLRPEFGLVM